MTNHDYYLIQTSETVGVRQGYYKPTVLVVDFLCTLAQQQAAQRTLTPQRCGV